MFKRQNYMRIKNERLDKEEKKKKKNNNSKINQF